MEILIKICMVGLFVSAAIMVFGDTTIAYKPMMIFAFVIIAFLFFCKKKVNTETEENEKEE